MFLHKKRRSVSSPANMPNRHAGCDSIGPTCTSYGEIGTDLRIGEGKMDKIEEMVLQ
jgi:hypothetical protein